jgi:hypothetical protein
MSVTLMQGDALRLALADELPGLAPWLARRVEPASVLPDMPMRWHRSNRADPRALPLADRHYNRQNPGSPQFVPPGSCLVLLDRDATALWVTLAPRAEYVRHQWAGAWTCTTFRNEGGGLSSDLIRQAVAATVWKYGTCPPQGFITFIDRDQTRPKRDPGFCYLMAGWHLLGQTKGGLYALGLGADEMPPALAPRPQRPQQPYLFSDDEPAEAAAWS